MWLPPPHFGRARWLRPVGLCLAGLCLGAGACNRPAPSRPAASPPPATGARAPAARARAERGYRPLSAMREQMKLIQVYAADLRRRVEHGVDVSGPARVIANLAARLPLAGAPTSLRAAARELEYRATQLASSRQPRAAFGAVVEACSSCHRLHAPALLRQVEALALPPAPDAR